MDEAMKMKLMQALMTNQGIMDRGQESLGGGPMGVEPETGMETQSPLAGQYPIADHLSEQGSHHNGQAFGHYASGMLGAGLAGASLATPASPAGIAIGGSMAGYGLHEGHKHRQQAKQMHGAADHRRSIKY